MSGDIDGGGVTGGGKLGLGAFGKGCCGIGERGGDFGGAGGLGGDGGDHNTLWRSHQWLLLGLPFLVMLLFGVCSLRLQLSCTEHLMLAQRKLVEASCVRAVESIAAVTYSAIESIVPKSCKSLAVSVHVIFMSYPLVGGWEGSIGLAQAPGPLVLR